ncbi:hypothetical protein GT204_32320 [Streptomyces sp. SID4919]|uniref:hypothetical protein n=1 Tax=unclassified Streptomyces TaxID=2593676 RepID=UPI000823AD31|nr:MULTISPECIES: hypothetical protein [unclassified Streptomyces]MYY13439.1 hypothetical protein [Streptomyces sp. SID4919]SCK61346.1 hypothetical protein YW7DRAFT_06259 [Streptomyces sp. AmelKG-E11A]
MTTKLKFDGGWSAAVTGEPLDLVPRLLGTFLIVSPYADGVEREGFLADTFGSQDLLWDLPDVFRFAPSSRRLVGAEFRIPEESASAEDSARLPVTPEVCPGGLRADEVKDFRHEMCTVLCRAPGDDVLTCLRDLDVLDEPLEARVGIAPDVALLVQQGTVVGWSLTDPARYLTASYADPAPDPPCPDTRRLLTECLDLITPPLVDDVVDREPAALTRLRALDRALRDQREDRHRADALLSLIATYVEDYAT